MALNKWWDGVLADRGSSFLDVLRSDASINKTNRNAIIQDAIVHAYAWVVWKARNNVIFRNIPFNSLRGRTMSSVSFFRGFVIEVVLGAL